MVKALLEQHGIITNFPINHQKHHPTEDAKEKAVPETPFLCGLNSVTRQMESLIKTQVGNQSEKLEAPTTMHAPSIIFVCQFDVDPPSLVSHLPLLTATYNAISKQPSYLIRLPKGSESHLSNATHLRRCSVLSIDRKQLTLGSDAQKGVDDLLAKVQESGVEEMRLDWIDKAIQAARGVTSQVHLIDSQIKHLRSSAPLDLNTIKTVKRTERTEKKEQRKKRKGAKNDNREEQLRLNKKSKKNSS